MLCGAALSVVATAAAGNRRIAVERLPVQARTFLKSHFANAGVAYASIDRELFGTSYEVALDNGTKVEFDRHGHWNEIKMANNAAVPASMVPHPIAEYVVRNYPRAHICRMEFDDGEYEAELSNGVEMFFDRDGTFLRSNDYTKPQPDHRLPLL